MKNNNLRKTANWIIWFSVCGTVFLVASELPFRGFLAMASLLAIAGVAYLINRPKSLLPIFD